MQKINHFELTLTFLKQNHNASHKQYLDSYHWIYIVLDPHVIQFPKPVKGFIKLLLPQSENLVTSYHASQLVQTAKEINVTKVELLKLFGETFDGKVHLHCYCWNYVYISC